MTLSEHLEQTSFAYVVPPDVAEGQPLTAARKCPPQAPPPIKRAWRTCTRVVSRKR
jgi:hypothetical protein